MLNKVIVYIFTLTILITGCKDNSDNSGSENYKVNSWVKAEMDYWYYWNSKIPNAAFLNYESAPESFFQSLLYHEIDKWSYITNDYTELIAESAQKSASTPSGAIVRFIKFSNTPNQIFAVVLYIQKGSAAELAGVKRGMIIEKINGKTMNNENYYSTFYNNENPVTYTYTESISDIRSKTITINKTIFTESPIILDSVYSIGGKNIGYIHIGSYSYIDNFKQFVSESLNKLSSANISDLIIDLRYNGGGYLNSAQWLSSAVVSQANVNQKNLLVKLDYNSIVSPSISDTEKEKRFVNTDYNFSINKLIFITGELTASASELTIIGLKPYTNSITIGDYTAGKCFGSIPIYDENNPSTKNYGIQPIVFKYTNSTGFTDFINGLTPDILIKEDYANLYPLGSMSDPLLSAALNSLTTTTKKVIISNLLSNNITILPSPIPLKNTGLINEKPLFE